MNRPLIASAAGLSLLALAGCGTTPATFGITGPGTGPGPTRPPPTSDDAALPSPGGVAPGAGTTYGPSMVPSYGTNGRYYGNQ
ncbi:MAG TPA: hypothetical protein VJY39_05705 [Acidisphaera sp.]|nr:hypothetical protein [Acidisphaera sp.]